MSKTEQKNRKRVLIADDEAPMRLLCSRILQVHGYQCDTARDGEEALNLIRRNNYDVIVVDLRMPFRSGLELLSTLRDEGRRVPALLISAYTHVLEPAEAADLATLQVASVMRKPFTMIELLRAIERAQVPQPASTGHVAVAKGQA